jgi:hypothetical protein
MLIDVELIRRSVEILQRPFEVIVQDALAHHDAEEAAPQVPEITRARITVRMTLTQKYLFSDAHVEHAVRRLLVDGGL